MSCLICFDIRYLECLKIKKGFLKLKNEKRGPLSINGNFRFQIPNFKD
jgi:hypothetical protein